MYYASPLCLTIVELINVSSNVNQCLYRFNDRFGFYNIGKNKGGGREKQIGDERLRQAGAFCSDAKSPTYVFFCILV